MRLRSLGSGHCCVFRFFDGFWMLFGWLGKSENLFCLVKLPSTKHHESVSCVAWMVSLVSVERRPKIRSWHLNKVIPRVLFGHPQVLVVAPTSVGPTCFTIAAL